jgi:hypothetical protein
MHLRRLVLAILIAILALPALGSARAQGPTDIVIEIFVEPGVMVPVRANPALAGAEIASFGNGIRLTWNGQVVLADGRNWMAVSAPGVTGWMSPDNDQVYPADPTKITNGADRTVVISPFSNSMTLFAAPGRNSQVVAQLPIGTPLRISDAPMVTDLYTWWPVTQENGTRGWVVDTGHELVVQGGLSVYGIPVCSNFNLKDFGAVGWDSVREVFPTTIRSNEQIVCLASTNMRGDDLPVVVVLTHTEAGNGPFDTLRLYEQQGDTWTIVYTEATEAFSGTERLSLHDFGTGVPMLMWNTRNQGTGSVLNVDILRYLEGVASPALTATVYKGLIQVNPTGLILFEADYLPDEPNCCPSGMRRMAYNYQDGAFVQLVNDVLPHPGAFQVRR